MLYFATHLGQSRSKETGRVVPVDLLERVIAEVPDSFRQLRPRADFAVEICNAEDDADDVELVDPGMDWDKFREHWHVQLLGTPPPALA
jgi:hypothetical protein